MSQSKKRSALESAVTTGIAVAYAVPVNYLFIQHVDMEPWLRATVLTGTFTVIGFAHKFLTRRFFNWLDERYPT